MNIFLMCCIWIPVLVVGVSLYVNYYDMDDPMPPRLGILLLVELIMAIIASIKIIPLWPAAIINVVIMVLYLCDLTNARLLAILGFVALFFVAGDSCVTLVKQGERAVKTVAGKVIPKTYGPELIFNLPCERWGFNVIKVSTRPQRYEYNNVVVRTKELQQVTLDCSILLQLTPDSIHVLYDKYTGYEDYEKNVVQDLVQSTMLALSSQMSFWSFAKETSHLMTEAINCIVNDQLMAENLAKIKNFRFLGYQASPELEALIEQTAQARQGVELEKWKLEKAKIETERVKQEAIQTYERLAAVAKANSVDVPIKAEALKNPFVAQYEVAKALQRWNGDLTLPNTLMTMSQAAGANGGGTTIFPIVPISTK